MSHNLQEASSQGLQNAQLHDNATTKDILRKVLQQRLRLQQDQRKREKDEGKMMEEIMEENSLNMAYSKI